MIKKEQAYLRVTRTEVVDVHVDEPEDESTIHEGETFLEVGI